VAGLKGRWSLRGSIKSHGCIYIPEFQRLPISSGRLVQEKSVKVLNVAGPRASKEPEVVRFVMALLDEVLGMPD
jgi:hypothetical protein